MKILIAHNRYQQPGGEDTVFAAETALLRRRGHEVVEYVEDNDRIDGMKPWNVAVDTIWSRAAYRNLRELLHTHRPDMAHFHNTFPLISPSAYAACRAESVPVVQTLHNYRLICPNAYLFRDGRPCEDCLRHASPIPGVVHACYRNSRPQTAVVATMLTAHRLKRTWVRDVDQYITLTEFARSRFIAGGLPEERLAIKPNFLQDDPGPGMHEGGFFLFVGRLDTNKGIQTLIDAWKNVSPGTELHIIGDGDLSNYVVNAAKTNSLIRFLGRMTRDKVIAKMRDARALISPSLAYETFGMSIIEAFACGLPVIASDLGAAAEIVKNGQTGLLFRPRDSTDLAVQVGRILGDTGLTRTLGAQARHEYLDNYTADRNYNLLMEIYDQARERARQTL